MSRIGQLRYNIPPIRGKEHCMQEVPGAIPGISSRMDQVNRWWERPLCLRLWSATTCYTILGKTNQKVGTGIRQTLHEWFTRHLVFYQKRCTQMRMYLPWIVCFSQTTCSLMVQSGVNRKSAGARFQLTFPVMIEKSRETDAQVLLVPRDSNNYIFRL